MVGPTVVETVVKKVGMMVCAMVGQLACVEAVASVAVKVAL